MKNNGFITIKQLDDRLLEIVECDMVSERATSYVVQSRSLMAKLKMLIHQELDKDLSKRKASKV